MKQDKKTGRFIPLTEEEKQKSKEKDFYILGNGNENTDNNREKLDQMVGNGGKKIDKIKMGRKVPRISKRVDENKRAEIQN